MNNRLAWIGAGMLVGVMAGVYAWWQSTWPGRLIPVDLAKAVPGECRQLIVVLPENVNAVPANVWLLERTEAVGQWRAAAGPMAASVGRNGTGWGRGLVDLPNPGNYPDKKEGDGRSPAGIFALPWAFGYAPSAPEGVRLPWVECTETLRGVDDVKSKYYNQILDEAKVPDKDWDSAEIMRRDDGAYEFGLMIGHNAERVAGGGSCIFLHLWKGPGQGTAGCTALAREDVRRILTWLDPAKVPLLVFGVR
jgi:hypothetical protein